MSGHYASSLELFLNATSAISHGAIDWVADTSMGVLLINTANYFAAHGNEAVALATDQDVADVAGIANVIHRRLLITDTDPVGTLLGAPLLPGPDLVGNARTAVGGVADASDVIFKAVVSVPAADPIGGLIIYKNASGVDASSPLLCLVTLAGTVLPNGGDIKLAWDNGANKVFKI